jgi:hypothetical protein
MGSKPESVRLRSRSASKATACRGPSPFLTKPLITEAADDKLRT